MDHGWRSAPFSPLPQAGQLAVHSSNAKHSVPSLSAVLHSLVGAIFIFIEKMRQTLLYNVDHFSRIPRKGSCVKTVGYFWRLPDLLPSNFHLPNQSNRRYLRKQQNILFFINEVISNYIRREQEYVLISMWSRGINTECVDQDDLEKIFLQQL